MYYYPGGTVTKDDFTSRMIECSAGLTAELARKICARYSPGDGF
jgi:hypothetical protein